MESGVAAASRRRRLPCPPRIACDTITVHDATGSSTKALMQIGGGGSSRMVVRFVAPSDLEPPRVLAPNAQAVRHVVNLVDPQLSLEVERYVMLQPPWTPEVATAAFYELYPDDYDFLFVSPGTPAFRGYAGVTTVVRNEVQGLGRSIVDNSATYGSAGRLQVLIGRNLDDAGPNLHELMHRWATSLSTSLGFGQCPPGHWGYVGIGLGALGGFDPATLVDDGDGTYSVATVPFGGRATDHDPYNPLELYLAGLLGPDDVPPMTMPVEVDCGGIVCEGTGCSERRFAADGLATVSVEDVIALHGPRVPDVSTSQKDFRLAWVVASHRPLNEVELAYYGWQAEYLGRSEGNGGFFIPFEVATGGRATLDTAIEIDGLAGVVPHVELGRDASGTHELRWDASCRPTDADYAVYRGSVGEFGDYAPLACSTDGRRTLDVGSVPAGSFFLVVPRSRDAEGSYGRDGAGLERAPSAAACAPSAAAVCSR